MPNYLLCDQFHVKISVLVHTCTVSSNVKRNLVQKQALCNSCALRLDQWFPTGVHKMIFGVHELCLHKMKTKYFKMELRYQPLWSSLQKTINQAQFYKNMII